LEKSGTILTYELSHVYEPELDFEMGSILVTGSRGMVGSAVVRQLNELKEKSLSPSSVDLNLLDRIETLSFLRSNKPKVVIACAARVGGIGANHSKPVEFLTENLQMQTNLLDACHQSDIAKVIFLSSSAIYPQNSVSPISETSLYNGSVEQANRPYAIAKIAGMELLEAYNKEYGHKWISLIPANVYGINDNYNPASSHVVAATIHKVFLAKRDRTDVEMWGHPETKRELLNVDDLAKFIAQYALPLELPQSLNVGSGIEITIEEIFQKVSQLVDFSGHVNWNHGEPTGVKRKLLDSSRAKSFGWKSHISFDEGLHSSLQDYIERFSLTKTI
jgi:GDP-L-fucose synthase